MIRADAARRKVDDMAVKIISIKNQGQVFAFRYDENDAARLIAGLAAEATNQNSEFDWFDAAVLSYQSGRQSETTNVRA